MFTAVHGCPLKSGARRELGIFKCNLISASEGPITLLIKGGMFLCMHPKIQLTFGFCLFAATLYFKFSVDSVAEYLPFGLLNHVSLKLFVWCFIYQRPKGRSFYIFLIMDSFRTNQRPTLIMILLTPDSGKVSS